MAAKTVTTPIAMAVSEQIGGMPALTAAFAILSGIIAAMSDRRLFSILKIADLQAQGLAADVAGSGIAAAQMVSLPPLQRRELRSMGWLRR